MITISDIIFRGLKLISRSLDEFRCYRGKYTFVNRSHNSDKVLIIVAGYQEYIWDIVFDRIKKVIPDDIDVCIVVPGKDDLRLKEIANLNKWSYLSVAENKLALAQNIAIKLHPNAEWIFKLDEDIFIGDGYFENLLKTYCKAVDDGIYQVGCISPVLNVNGAGYSYVLEKLNSRDEYVKCFGSARNTCDNDPIYLNAKAAEYMWKLLLPLDKYIDMFSKDEIAYYPVPFRLSIGAFLIKREFWNQMGGFKVAAAGQLAWEEMCMCSYCMNYSKAILIAKNVLAGHFGFGCQKKDVKKFFENNIEEYCYKKDL